MNEKYLWELWAKCKHPHPEFGGGDMVWPIEFAELIVRECVAICRDIDGEDNIDAKSGRQDCAVEIKEHFGVEE
jgi:hypothetical protein